MLGTCKNGVSSYELHRAIGFAQKRAWFMLRTFNSGRCWSRTSAPPCKGEDGRCRVLQPLAELPYLSRFLFSALPCVAQYCVPGGVGVVSTGGGSVGLASLVPVHLQDDPALALVYFFPFGGCRPCEPRATVSVDHRGTHAG